MSLINLEMIRVLNPVAKFSDDYAFEITFTCVPPGVKEELEWKLVYVGSAEDEKYDQELDDILVGPVPIGKNQFIFQAPAPDLTRIPPKDLVGVTAILLMCIYKGQEFIRVGYYVNVFEEGKELANQEVLPPPISGMTGPTTNTDGAEGMQTDDVEVVTDLPAEPKDAPPVDVTKLMRSVLQEKPRVTKFQIPWDTVVPEPVYSTNSMDVDEQSAMS